MCGEERKAAEDNRYDRGNSGEKRASRDHSGLDETVPKDTDRSLHLDAGC